MHHLVPVFFVSSEWSRETHLHEVDPGEASIWHSFADSWGKSSARLALGFSLQHYRCLLVADPHFSHERYTKLGIRVLPRFSGTGYCFPYRGRSSHRLRDGEPCTTPVSDSDQPSDPPGSTGRWESIDDRTPPSDDPAGPDSVAGLVNGGPGPEGQWSDRELTSKCTVYPGVVVEVLYTPVVTADA